MNSATIQTQIDAIETEIVGAVAEAIEVGSPDDFSAEAANALAVRILSYARDRIAHGFDGCNTFEEGANYWRSLYKVEIKGRAKSVPHDGPLDEATMKERRELCGDLMAAALPQLLELHGLHLALGIAKSIEEIKAA